MGRRHWAAAAIAGNPPLGRKWAQTRIANWENIQFCDLKVEVQHQNLLELPWMDGWMDGWTQWIQWIQWMDGSISPYFPNPIHTHTDIYIYIYFLFVWDTPWHRFSLRTDGFFLGAPRISRTTAVVCPDRGILPAS